MRGYEIVARCLRRRGVDVIFYVMGGPVIDCELACQERGIRMLDVRHEQAAAMMAHAYARLRRAPAVCMAASGPGTVNLVTGIATAYADSAPVVALGGSSALWAPRGTFQETDQVALFRPITRWSERCVDTQLLPVFVDRAFAAAFDSRPGPVYLDLPDDMLYRDVDEAEIRWVDPAEDRIRISADSSAVEQAVDLLTQAERPVAMIGSGALWSGADSEAREFVERFAVPFFTTPMSRGVIPEDHELSFLGARSAAFRDADLIISVGTRQNYVTAFMQPPRWNAAARLIQIDIDPHEMGLNREPDVGIIADVKRALSQVLEASDGDASHADWIEHLRGVHEAKVSQQELVMNSDSQPIHPLRLCKELRDFLPREKRVLCVDGHEILAFARQSIPFYEPRSLTPGTYGCMGVGLPFALAAKLALPDHLVVVLHGDGSFGWNGMEMDTALRHDIPIICVIGNNGGHTADSEGKIGRELGHTRYDAMFGAIGCHAEFVEDPAQIRPALERAAASGKPAIVNVVTDPKAKANDSIVYTPARMRIRGGASAMV